MDLVVETWCVTAEDLVILTWSHAIIDGLWVLSPILSQGLVEAGLSATIGSKGLASGHEPEGRAGFTLFESWTLVNWDRGVGGTTLDWLSTITEHWLLSLSVCATWYFWWLGVSGTNPIVLKVEYPSGSDLMGTTFRPQIVGNFTTTCQVACLSIWYAFISGKWVGDA